MYHAIVGATGFQNFFPTLTKTLYPDQNTKALLLVAPPYLFIMAYALAHSIASDKVGNRKCNG